MKNTKDDRRGNDPQNFRCEEFNKLNTVKANHSYEGSTRVTWATTEVKLVNGLSLFLRTEDQVCYDGTASASNVTMWVGDDKTDRAEYIGQITQEEIRGERGGTYNDVSMHTSQGKGKKGLYRTIIRENEYGEDLI